MVAGRSDKWLLPRSLHMITCGAQAFLAGRQEIIEIICLRLYLHILTARMGRSRILNILETRLNLDNGTDRKSTRLWRS